jgi:hypothetical protein
MSIVTCRTPGCVNQGVEIEVSLAGFDPITGDPIEVGVVMCGGGCGQQITKVVAE